MDIENRPMTSPRRLIQPPPSSSIFGTSIIVIAVILLSIVPFSLKISIWVAVISLLLVAAAVFSRDSQSLHLSLFTAALIVLPYLLPSLRTWPYALLIPILCYAAVVLMVPNLRRSILWLRIGRFGKDMIFLVVAIGVISGLALYAWYAALKPDLGMQLGHMPAMPVWLFPMAGLAFAIGNAAMEEFAFRGVIMQALDSAAWPGIVSILIQAWLFGAMHFLQGFPRGGWGLAMTIVYGIMLGGIRRRSQGMLAPWVAHVFADLVIFMILADIVLKKSGAI